MYESQVRLDISRELVAQEYQRQHRRSPQISCRSLYSTIPFSQFFRSGLSAVEIAAERFKPSSTANVSGGRLMRYARLAAGVAALGLALGVSGCGVNTNPFTSGGMALNPSSVEFGDVTIGNSAKQALQITNSGTSSIQIQQLNFSSSSFAASAGALPATIPAGGSVSVQLTYDPKSATDSTAQLQVTGTTSTSSRVSGWVKLHGRGSKSTSTLSSLSCAKSSMSAAGSDACTVTLSAAAPSGGIVVNLASSSTAVTIPGSVTVASGANSVSFTATISAVTTSQTATLIATQGAISKSASISLNGSTTSSTGPGTPALSVNATSVPFGAVVVNHTTTQTVTLTASGTAAVTVNSIAVTGSGFSATQVSLPATLNPGQTLPVTLSFDPTTVGAASGQVTITSNSSTNSTITIGLSGTGNPHQVDLSWVAPGGSSVPVAGYKVYRAASGTGAFALLNSVGTQTIYVDSTVQSGKSYDYQVTSVDSSGTESSPSNMTTVTIP